ncbi:WYL domain-containing protein [Sulfurimonas sp. HSL-1656]|uniref:helix-turn-helix transcriptional regulator n=1 Tax=Thiomicrolovo subterrani TaxID=3131934 RepID=UPI0031F93A54
MNQKMIDALPRLLKRLSNGEGLHIPTLSKELDIPEKTLQDNIKKYLLPLDFADIQHDHTTRKWTARRNFLSETLLSPDELICMSVLDSASEKYGRRFILATQRLFNRFKRRASLSIYKKINMEHLDRDDEIKLAIIKSAIKSKTVLNCKYSQKARTFHPLKIVMLEGYWYLFHWDVNDKMIKKFHLKSIQSLELTKEHFDDPHSDVINKLDGAVNAYFKDKPPTDVELLVHKRVSKYFERQPLSKHQRIFDYDENYKRMYIPITDEMEIIPTIQQYLPYIKVLSPQSLHQQIEANISNYSKIDLD